MMHTNERERKKTWSRSAGVLQRVRNMNALKQKRNLSPRLFPTHLWTTKKPKTPVLKHPDAITDHAYSVYPRYSFKTCTYRYCRISERLGSHEDPFNIGTLANPTTAAKKTNKEACANYKVFLMVHIITTGRAKSTQRNVIPLWPGSS